MNGRAESYGGVKKRKMMDRRRPWGWTYVYVHSERQKEEKEKSVPITVAKDNKMKTITARVVPSKGLESYSTETMKKMVER